MNFRLDNNHNTVVELVEKDALTDLFEDDQLHKLRCGWDVLVKKKIKIQNSILFFFFRRLELRERMLDQGERGSGRFTQRGQRE